VTWILGILFAIRERGACSSIDSLNGSELKGESIMGDPSENEGATNAVTKPEPATPIPLGKVLAGTEKLFDGDPHVGVAIEVAASGKISHLVISDATRITSGAPIFITAPVRLKGTNLQKFLDAKGVAVPDPLKGLLNKLEVGCEAFYFSTKKRKLSADEATKYKTDRNLNETTTPKASDVIAGYEVEDGPLLMMFEIQVQGGLIKALTNDDALSSLFDINSAQLRVLRCPASSKDILVKYAESLPEQ
jgi:hypothetical protein